MPGRMPSVTPGTHNVISNFSFDAQQIAGAYFQFVGVVRMNPKRICMRDFVEPFGVGAKPP